MDGTTPCRGRRAYRPGTSTPKGRFVLRADSIRPYNPCGKLIPFIELSALQGECKNTDIQRTLLFVFNNFPLSFFFFLIHFLQT